jgi:hypothetical protein
MSAATGLAAARATVEALREGIGVPPGTVTADQGYALRILDIVSDCFDLVEDVLGLNPGEACPHCGEILDPGPMLDEHITSHEDDDA